MNFLFVFLLIISFSRKVIAEGDGLHEQPHSNQSEQQERRLFNAAEHGNIEVVRDLLAQGVNPNKKYHYGKTPLHLAAQNGHTGIVQELLARGAKINATDLDFSKHWTALHYAAQNGHAETVQVLASAPGINLHAKDAREQTPLHLAAGNGHEKTVQALLTFPVRLNEKDYNGRTPIHLAVQSGHKGTMRILLKSGADPGVSDRANNTAVDYDHQRMKQGFPGQFVKADLLSHGLDNPVSADETNRVLGEIYK